VQVFSWKQNHEKRSGGYLYMHSHLIFGKIYICNKLSRIITSANVSWLSAQCLHLWPHNKIMLHSSAIKYSTLWCINLTTVSDFGV
jgi:hypothetical protein